MNKTRMARIDIGLLDTVEIIYKDRDDLKTRQDRFRELDKWLNKVWFGVR